MKKTSLAAMSAIILAGCNQAYTESAEAPTVICDDSYTEEAGKEFNLFDWISISGNNSDSHVHVNVRGNIDNETPGDYRVVLTAYDESGNISIRNLNVTITEPEVKDVEESAEETPIPDQEEAHESENESKQKPIATHAPTPTAASVPVESDPYKQEREECIASYGTWMETYCSWPNPAPVETTHSGPALPAGGQTSCWYEGNMQICEWVSEWIEEYD